MSGQVGSMLPSGGQGSRIRGHLGLDIPQGPGRFLCGWRWQGVCSHTCVCDCVHELVCLREKGRVGAVFLGELITMHTPSQRICYVLEL